MDTDDGREKQVERSGMLSIKKDYWFDISAADKKNRFVKKYNLDYDELWSNEHFCYKSKQWY